MGFSYEIIFYFVFLIVDRDKKQDDSVELTIREILYGNILR